MAKKENIKAVILDKDGVFVDFHKLWLRIIAYRAQKIAEYSSNDSITLDAIRRACIVSMGVDEDDETIDPHSPISSPYPIVRTALATAVYMTKADMDPLYNWKAAYEVVDKSIKEVNEELNYIDLVEAIPGSIEKIKEIAKSNLRLAIFTSDSEENTKAILEKFDLSNDVEIVNAGQVKDAEAYKELCSKLKLEAAETLMVSDAPSDLRATQEAGAYAVAVLSGIVRKNDDISPLKICSDEVIDSLADLDLEKIACQKI